MNSKDRRIVVNLIRTETEDHFRGKDRHSDSVNSQNQSYIQGMIAVADALNIDIGDAAYNPKYKRETLNEQHL